MNSTHSLYSRSSSSTNPNELITYIFPDFKAVSYFQKDFIVSNEFHIIEESTASGFDIYLVEQWVSNRKIGTIVSTFTGNPTSKVSVFKFTILKKQSNYYPLKFREYLNEIMLNHAKIKRMEEEEEVNSNGSSFNENETINKVLFVTNLTELPSNLNLIAIPNGDSRKIQNDFMINSNLKKLQCSGRSLSLITDKISDANEDKFRQMYKIYNVNIPIKFAILGLVNIIQICLFYFDLLEAKYCDGLLCSKTEEAIMNWWNLVGLPHFNIRPSLREGILPARTVAGIISLILSTKIRLQLIGGCDVPKDPFDFENFMISIGQFQKQFKLDKRRKLDLETLSKLFGVTNAKLAPERSRNYYNSDPLYDNSEQYELASTQSNLLNLNNNLTSSSLSYPVNSLSNNGSSPYKKNKSYYSKEFKKLTNVVKNTVSDHINAANRDNEENNSNPKSSSIRIRNKIAKLADNLSPLDVETLDLEILVKNYLTGKALIQLWHGISNAQYDPSHSTNTNNVSPHHHNHRHYRHNVRHSTNLSDKNQYVFFSLKDKINNTQTLSSASSSMTDLSRYSRGLNKMKLGLQNRRLLLSTNGSKKNNNSNASNSFLEADDNLDVKNNSARSNSISIVDSLLQIPNDGSSCDIDNDSSSIMVSGNCLNAQNNPLEKLNSKFNRRNSFPFFLDRHEGNLNVIEFSRSDISYDPDMISNSFKTQRSLSFSNIEEYLYKPEQCITTTEKFSYRYLKTISQLIKYDNLEKLYNMQNPPINVITNETIKKSYKQLNLELIKLNNIHNQMITNKIKIIDNELLENLEYNINDLTATIDRLIYETRIVVKRINELEENSKLLDVKLNDQCMNKLSRIIDNLIYSNKFREVFVDDQERNDIILKLTGSDPTKLNFKQDVSKQQAYVNIFRIIVIFIYDLITFIFQLFKFDRSNMNLDRIRQSWIKLDPNRNIINKAYSFLGKEPSRGSIASFSDENKNAKSQ